MAEREMTLIDKAREFWEKWADATPYIPNSWDRAMSFAAAFAAACVAEERERACKDVCWYCADPKLPKVKLFGTVWGHPAGSDNYIECRASAIRSRQEGS